MGSRTTEPPRDACPARGPPFVPGSRARWHAGRPEPGTPEAAEAFRADRHDAALEAYDRALELAGNAPERAFLRARRFTTTEGFARRRSGVRTRRLAAGGPPLPMRYVALIRAINVGGRSTIAMADLRALVEAAGMADVTTYIQTGNVVFGAPRTGRARLAARLEDALAERLGERVMVLVRTRRDLEAALARCPFDPEHDPAVAMCHLLFLDRAPDAARRRALLARQGEEYRFHVDRDVVYYAYPRAARGRRRSIDFEGLLGARGTGRSIGVVRKLVDLAA